MKKKSTENIVSYRIDSLPADTATDWDRVDAFTDEELERNALSDKETLLADESFWRNAQLRMPLAVAKERITIRLDSDILAWLKQDTKRGYQTRINIILRSCMNALNHR